MKTTTSSLWNRLVSGSAVLALAPALFALTPQETVSLQYMSQEEKLARDVYQALAVRWEHPAFTRIAASEQRHMNALASLLQRHAVTDTTPTEPGRFSIPELQALHDTLVAAGDASLEAALQVGIKIEETDIADLKEAIQATQAADLLRVFGQLSAASERHLNAFTVALQDPTSTTPACTGAGACPGAGNCPQGVQGNGMGKGPGKGAGAACGLGGRQGGRRGGPGGGAATTCPQGTPAGGSARGNATGNAGTGTCPNLDAGTPVPPPVTPPAATAPRTRNGQR